MSPKQFFSHVTAAQLYGLPLPYRLAQASALHVCVVKPNRAPRIPGVVGHHVEAGTVTIHQGNGIRVASPVDTWCQLSTILGLDDLIIIGDALVCRNNPLATMDELRAAVLAFHGRRGALLLREALKQVRPRTDSPRETRLRLLIIRAGLPEPGVNCLIINRYGAEIALGDLVYLEYKILIEYDGGQHRENEKQYHRDIDRLDDVMEEGFRVIRVNKSHLDSRPANIIGRVRTALLARGWRAPMQ